MSKGNSVILIFVIAAVVITLVVAGVAFFAGPNLNDLDVKSENEKEIKDLLIKCIYSRVRWREIIQFFNGKNIKNFVECGPGKALTNMFKRFEFDIKSLKLDNLEDINNYE